MFVPPSAVLVRFTFVDRGQRRSEVTLRFRTALSLLDILASIEVLSIAYSAVSDSVITDISITWKYTNSQPATPGIGSNSARKAWLFYSNGDMAEGIIIPSPIPDIFEVEGPLPGVRVDATHSGIVALNDWIAAHSALLLTPDGEPFPTLYIVGGLVQ